jgi:hypothetical protein
VERFKSSDSAAWLLQVPPPQCEGRSECEPQAAAEEPTRRLTGPWRPLSDAHMRLLEASGGAEGAAGALRLPSLSAPGDAVLVPWMRHSRAICQALGLVAAAAGSGDAPESVLALAQLHHASSVACGGRHVAPALPAADSFLVLMHALFGGDAGKLAPALDAAAVVPAGAFLWPRAALVTRGAPPQLALAAAARAMLAAELPAPFAALERAGATNALLARWLPQLLLPVLTVPLAARVLAAALLFGPLVLPAAAVAALHCLRRGIAAATAAGDDTLTDWLRAVHCFDAAPAAFLTATLDIEGRHRDALLPLLCGGSASALPCA